MENSDGQLLVLSIFMIVSIANATQFKVGGTSGWTVPDSNSMSYNQWAEKNRFQIGDSLLFVYLPVKDSVLLVDADAYNSCDTSTFVDNFNDGYTVFTFTHSGPFYFISGNKENCQKNAKLVTVVMADRSNNSILAPTPAAISSPPPPTLQVVEEPTAQPPPNGASTKVASLISVLGPLFGSILYVF